MTTTYVGLYACMVHNTHNTALFLLFFYELWDRLFYVILLHIKYRHSAQCNGIQRHIQFLTPWKKNTTSTPSSTHSWDVCICITLEGKKRCYNKVRDRRLCRDRTVQWKSVFLPLCKIQRTSDGLAIVVFSTLAVFITKAPSQ